VAAQSSLVIRIDDPKDERLADYRDLNDAELRRRREEKDAIFVVEGRVAVRQLLRSSHEIVSLLVDDHQVHAIADVVAEVQARHAPVYVGGREVVAATVGFSLHRGVVAVARRPLATEWRELVATALEAKPPDRQRAVFAVLEAVNDHENLGAIFRNAAAFGVAGVLLDATCADPLYRRSVRVSVGHVLTVPFARIAPFPEGLAELRRTGVRLAALSPNGDLQLDTFERDANPVALLLGAEGPGLTNDTMAQADQTYAISMAPGVDSLNVATAAAIAFYELTRH
jgi:tRNA G18 (ribose-2'-O)-methylase SpoU